MTIREHDVILTSINKALRRKDAPSRYALAETLGVRPQNVYRYLDGDTRMTTAQASALMRRLGLRVTRKR